MRFKFHIGEIKSQVGGESIPQYGRNIILWEVEAGEYGCVNELLEECELGKDKGKGCEGVYEGDIKDGVESSPEKIELVMAFGALVYPCLGFVGKGLELLV